MRDQYLKYVTLRTAIWLVIIQYLTMGFWWLLSRTELETGAAWYGLALAQSAIAFFLLTLTVRHVQKTKAPANVQPVSTRDLPSLTVAIPARNETIELERCLRQLVASDYPKLEIIVLDDCSQNGRTPEIIRGFAHDGVRFIAGTPTEDDWLPKNHAYQQLSDEANGAYILFCGVDAQFEPTSLRKLVLTMLQKKKTMLSIIPSNTLHTKHLGLSMLVQPMRYAWELSLPRKFFRRPPVLSTCWIIQRKLLDSSGGFKAVSRSVVPESYFARTAIVHDGYSFMQSNQSIGISCDKSQIEQHDTATRTKYPQLHRRPEIVFLLTLAELMIIVLPVSFLVACLAAPDLRLLAGINGLTVLFLVGWYVAIVSLTYRTFVPLSLIAMPFAIIHDVALLNYSMLKYEFSEVYWKGRNICIPVMRVEAKLPSIERTKGL